MISYDALTHQVIADGRAVVVLPGLRGDLLRELACGVVIPKSDLIGRLWGDIDIGNRFNWAIFEVRKLLTVAGISVDYVPHSSYRLSQPVTVIGAPAMPLGEVWFDAGTGRVLADGFDEVKFPKHSSRIIEVLASGRILTHGDIISSVWGNDEPEFAMGSLQVHVCNINAKLRRAGLPLSICGIAKYGYYLSKKIKVIYGAKCPVIIPHELRNDFLEAIETSRSVKARNAVLSAVRG